MATTPNYGWVTPAPSDFVVDLPADFETFADAVDADLAGLLGGTTNQVLKKTSNADHAFAFGVDPTFDLVTTAGDLVYGTGADAMTRLGIGTAGQVLTVNSGATAPQWSTPAAGGMTSISSGNVTGTLNITSIPGTYKDLVLVIRNFRPTNDGQTLAIAPNGFTASTATSLTTYGNLTAQSFSSTGFSDVIGATSNQTPNNSFAIIWLYDYTSSGWKTAETFAVSVNASNTAQANIRRLHYISNKTAATTSIEFSVAGGVAAGTYILYGVN